MDYLQRNYTSYFRYKDEVFSRWIVALLWKNHFASSDVNAAVVDGGGDYWNDDDDYWNDDYTNDTNKSRKE